MKFLYTIIIAVTSFVSGTINAADNNAKSEHALPIPLSPTQPLTSQNPTAITPPAHESAEIVQLKTQVDFLAKQLEWLLNKTTNDHNVTISRIQGLECHCGKAQPHDYDAATE